MIEYCSINL